MSKYRAEMPDSSMKNTGNKSKISYLCGNEEDMKLGWNPLFPINSVWTISEKYAEELKEDKKLNVISRPD